MTLVLEGNITTMVFAQVVPPSSSDHDALMTYLAAVLLVAVAGFAAVVIPLLIKTHREASAANDAVNHRHLRTDANGDTPSKLYDTTLAIQTRLGELASHVERQLAENDRAHEYIIGLIHSNKEAPNAGDLSQGPHGGNS